MDNIYRIKYQSRLYELPYTVVYSNRKSCSISISLEDGLVLRVPLRTSAKEIQHLLLEKQHWIITKYLEMQEKKQNRPVSD